MSIRINWRQKSASDGCVRIHRILRNQPTRCQFAKMAGDIQDLRTEAEVLNRPLFDIIPEVRTQGFEQLLTQVYQTGQRFVAEEIPLNFVRDGQLVKSYAKQLSS